MRTSFNLKSTSAPNLGALIATVKDRVSIEAVAQALNLSLSRIGNSLQGDCPTGHKSVGHRCFSINTDQQFYNCFSCPEAGDVVALVKLVQKVGTMTAVKWVVDNFAPDLRPKVDSAIDDMPEEAKDRYHRATLYGLIVEEGKRQLCEPVGKVVLDYLINDRRYDPSKLSNTEFIYWDTESKIRAFLLSKAPHLKDEIASLPLNGGFGDNFRLAIPFRDRHGMITGFLKRAHEKMGFTINGTPGVRWDSTKGLTKMDLFGLNRIQKQEELIIVEGYPDATYLPALGLDNIVACGQAAFSDKYMEGLRAKKVKRIILALDNDGGTGIRNSVDICRSFAESDIEVFVIDPPAMGVHKDPDEYVVANGVDAFRKLVEGATNASMWMSKHILAQHDLTSDIGKQRAIDEVLEYADSLQRPTEAELVVGKLAQCLNLTLDSLSAEFQRVQKKQAADSILKGIAEATRKAEQLIGEGSPDEAAQLLQDKNQELIADFRRATEKQQTPLMVFLQQKRKVDSTRVSGQRLGYELKDFATIDKELQGLQRGLYILAADPNIGKTALMVNLAIDVLASNPTASTLFFTMDDSRDTIINRFLAHLADKAINDVRYKPLPADQQVIDDAYRQIEQWVSNGRLDIRELTESLTMSSIQDEVRNHPNRCELVVFIDGLYNVPMDNDFRSIREENIQRANQVKQLVKLYTVPVIATAEYRKQSAEEAGKTKARRTVHDIMETGKYGYNADVIILLSPKEKDQYGLQDEPIILAEFGKNKISSFRGTIEMKFLRAKSVMVEQGTVSTVLTTGDFAGEDE